MKTSEHKRARVEGARVEDAGVEGNGTGGGGKKRDDVQSVLEWWEALRPSPDGKKRGDRGTLAKLRRCNTVVELLFEPAVQTLITLIQGDGGIHNNKIHEDKMLRLALAAGILAYVREDDVVAVARRIGVTKEGDDTTALCKPVRFRRLLAASSFDECLRGFRRLIRLLGGKAHVEGLAYAALAWPKNGANPAESADTIRIRWIYDYWNTKESSHIKPSEDLESQEFEKEKPE